MLNTVRCQGFRARKVLKVVWLQAATTAISVALPAVEDHQRGEVRREGQRHRQRLAVERRRHRHRDLEDRGEDRQRQHRRERGRTHELETDQRGRGDPGASGHDGKDVDPGDEGERLHQARDAALGARSPGSVNRHAAAGEEIGPDGNARHRRSVRTAAVWRCYSEQSLWEISSGRYDWRTTRTALHAGGHRPGRARRDAGPGDGAGGLAVPPRVGARRRRRGVGTTGCASTASAARSTRSTCRATANGRDCR